MTAELRILAIPGSLRALSYNRALLTAAQEIAPAGVTIEIFDLHDVPPYNADIEAEGNPPEIVRLKQAVAEAHGLLIATPQYNGSISGVLKNAIDWCSRPAFESVLLDKPIAVIGATPGKSETARAREDTERILEACRAVVLPTPKFGLGQAGDHIDEGDVHSPEAQEMLVEVIDALAAFCKDQALVAAD